MKQIFIVDDDIHIGNMLQDVLTKPFHIQELLARIQVHLRTSSVSGTHRLIFEDLTLDTDTRCVTAADTEVRLTPTEYAILKTLMENPTQVITKSILLDRLSEQTPDGTENSLKMHIRNLCKKYQKFTALDNLTMHIPKGAIYGFIDHGHMLKELTADELNAVCRKCVTVTVTDTKALSRVLTEMGVEYKILSDTTADIYADVHISRLALALDREHYELISVHEHDESLESYYVNLVGGDHHE